MSVRPDTYEQEISAGERFRFGRNWSHFVDLVDDHRIATAETSLRTWLGVERLGGKRFVDVGSGSGLFSLAAHRLGARVQSFDYDPDSVESTRRLRQRAGDPADWTVERGSMLDPAFLSRVEPADVVYCYGVAHHTGDMWRALGNLACLVAPGGQLYVALYNDQGRLSDVWRAIKQIYCSGPAGKLVTMGLIAPVLLLVRFLRDVVTLKNPLARYRDYQDRTRGMSPWRDLIDWLGGYPFEVAGADRVFAFFAARGFRLERLLTVGGGSGNNEFVFRRESADIAQVR